MGLIKHEPFGGFGNLARSFQNFMDEFDNRLAYRSQESEFLPKVDISEDDNNYFFQVEIPGMPKEDIKIRVNDDRNLVIEGEKKSEEKQEDRKYYRVERSYGKFTRTFSLPDNVNNEDIEAKFDNGVVNIRIAKKEPVKPKQIEVEVK